MSDSFIILFGPYRTIPPGHNPSKPIMNAKKAGGVIVYVT